MYDFHVAKAQFDKQLNKLYSVILDPNVSDEEKKSASAQVKEVDAKYWRDYLNEVHRISELINNNSGLKDNEIVTLINSDIMLEFIRSPTIFTENIEDVYIKEADLSTPEIVKSYSREKYAEKIGNLWYVDPNKFSRIGLVEDYLKDYLK